MNRNKYLCRNFLRFQNRRIMPNLLYSLLLVGAFFCTTIGVLAQPTVPTPTTQQQKRKVYMFAVSQNLVDDSVYVSAVQAVESVTFETNGFVAYPQLYAAQFKRYVETHRNEKMQTASIFYFEQQEKALKAWNKLREITNGQKVGGNQLRVFDVTRNEFAFSLIP